MTKYKHFKGAIYEKLHTATHSETEEQLVIYKDPTGRVFARPYDMFFEEVEVDGEMVPRFSKLP